MNSIEGNGKVSFGSKIIPGQVSQPCLHFEQKAIHFSLEVTPPNQISKAKTLFLTQLAAL
jgi:hypothetical protein